jgi:hypothetical protein
MATYRTPGVYIEEISTLPPSVAPVSTAIPAFIGYTETRPMSGTEPVVKRINTMLEYRTSFGAAPRSSFTAEYRSDNNSELNDLTRDIQDYEYGLYYNLSLYFQNGGGSCYVVSIGDYNTAPDVQHFEDGLIALGKEDEPTLILLTDAVNLLPADTYYALCQKALEQCHKLGDRFTILDVKQGNNAVEYFRDNIGSQHLSYGAAYYPYVQTTLSYDYAETEVKIKAAAPRTATWHKDFGSNGINVRYTGGAADTPSAKIVMGQDVVQFSVSPQKALTITAPVDTTAAAIALKWQSAENTTPKQGFDLTQVGDGTTTAQEIKTDNVDLDKQPANQLPTVTLASIKSDNTALYNQIKAAIARCRVELPPSAAIAGVYASVDRDRGVWKAPANVSLSAVLGPSTKITSQDQESLNIDPTAGKSVNAIRAFTGKGTMVWGARTLAGNDNEWRYVSIRRLFIMIEESVQKATAFAVFEPNDATTWLKVKAMIESYLYGLWEQGALAGPTPEAAYFVEVGLGTTMTAQDVLEGRMIVEIGVAAARPAEFIILKFSHKMQEA